MQTRFGETWRQLTRPDPTTSTIGTVAQRTGRAARTVRQVVSPLGWAVLATAAGGWVVGGVLGWHEAFVIAAACLIVLALSAFFLLGRANLRVEVVMQPRRVSVGSPAAGQVTVRNVSPRRMWPIRLELRVGAAIARFNLPMLASGRTVEELFVLPTTRRAVVPVGPARTVRGDPLGLLRREVPWTGVTELYVHPKVVGLDPLGSGLLRDLEGQSSTDISPSDLAFHTLRDYAAGDDWRYIHWRSSARTGQLMVRQFVDTRRIHATLIVDGQADSYGDPDEFEVALSAAGSIGLRALADDQQASVIASGEAVADGTVQQLLDALTRADFGDAGLAALAGNVLRNAPDTSIAVLITGSALDFSSVRRAAFALPPELDIVALCVNPSARPALNQVGQLTVLTLTKLADLPALMRAVAER